VLLVAEFCLTFKGFSVEELSLPSLYLGYYTTNSMVSLMFQLFGKLSARVTTSREKIHAVKENLQKCSHLLYLAYVSVRPRAYSNPGTDELIFMKFIFGQYY